MVENLVDSIAPAKTSSTAAAALAVALREKLRGEVRFDNGSRALYATDGSNYRQVPIGVVLPYDVYDVLMTSAKRWWVITHHTNLYAQSDFKSMDQAFTYHLGMMRVLNEQFKTEPDELQAEYVNRPWRRLQSAFSGQHEEGE